MLTLRAGVAQRTVTIKESSAFHKAPALPESYHQIFLYNIRDTRGGSFNPIQSCSRCILHSQPRPLGVVTNMLDSDIVINKFKLQAWHHMHFRTNKLE